MLCEIENSSSVLMHGFEMKPHPWSSISILFDNLAVLRFIWRRTELWFLLRSAFVAVGSWNPTVPCLWTDGPLSTTECNKGQKWLEIPSTAIFVSCRSIRDHLKCGRLLRMNRHQGQLSFSTSRPTSYSSDLRRTLSRCAGMFGGSWTGILIAMSASYTEKALFFFFF